MQNTSYIDQVLRDGSEKANELSSKKLADIKKKFGFSYFWAKKISKIAKPQPISKMFEAFVGKKFFIEA